jgi:hypothetical protein
MIACACAEQTTAAAATVVRSETRSLFMSASFEIGEQQSRHGVYQIGEV